MHGALSSTSVQLFAIVSSTYASCLTHPKAVRVLVMLLLRMVRVLLVVVVRGLLVQSLTVRGALGLHTNAYVGTRLLGSRTRGGRRSGWARWEHGRVLHVRLRNTVPGVVWRAIVLVLRIRVVVVRVGRGIALLEPLSTSCRLRLTSALRGSMLLGRLCA